MFASIARIQRRPLIAYSIAIALFIIALIGRFALTEVLPTGFPFLTFFPAILLSAYLGGIGPGIACATISTVAAWYWFIPPVGGFSLNLQSAVALVFFIVISIVDLLIIHVMQQSLHDLRQERNLTRTLLTQQKTLFQELQHRVANNLAFVSSLLSLQSRKLGDNPEAKAAMADARVRLETMSRVHRRLYSPDRIDLPIGEFLEEVCNDLIGASASQKIRLSVQMPPVSFSPQTVMTLTLIVVEIVTNSLKHAFHDVENPELTVVLAQTSPSTYSLSVKDNGPGLTGSGSSPGSKTSLGMRILDNFAKSLNGTMSTYNERGLRTVITFAPH